MPMEIDSAEKALMGPHKDVTRAFGGAVDRAVIGLIGRR